MEIRAVAHAADRGPISRVDLVANGTTITLADAPGAALHVVVVGADGGPIVDVTIRKGPSGED